HVPGWHHRCVLPPVRGHDLRFDGPFRVQLADAQPGPGGAAPQTTCRPPGPPLPAAELDLGWFFRGFNWLFVSGTALYTRAVGGLLRISLITLLVYGGLLVLTYFQFTRAPTGFIPEQDAGYLMLTVQLPDSASVQRTEQVMNHIDQIARNTPGVGHTVGVSGQSLILNANAPNLGSMYVILKPFDEPSAAGLRAAAIAK